MELWALIELISGLQEMSLYQGNVFIMEFVSYVPEPQEVNGGITNVNK